MSPDVLPASKKVALVQEGFSMGQDRGVVVLDAIHYHDYSAVFLVAHEVGHDLYLTHPFEVGEDHSQSECLMNYPKNMGGKGGKGKALPDFCEKCQKKLRGWTIRSTLTDTND